MSGQKTLTIKRKKLTLSTKSTSKRKPTLSLSKKSTTGKKSTLSLSKKSVKPEASKPKAVKPKAVKPEVVELESAASKAKKIDKELMESSEVWGNYLPLSIGIKKVMSPDFKSRYSVNGLKLLLGEHTSNKKYLQNIIDMENRQDLQGVITSEITPVQKEAAQARLDAEDFET